MGSETLRASPMFVPPSMTKNCQIDGRMKERIFRAAAKALVLDICMPKVNLSLDGKIVQH